jgi:hypothetical protein
MDTFRYSKLWKMRLWVGLGSALAFLLMFLGIGIFVVWPSQRNPIAWIEFGWWVPYLMIFLFIVSIIYAVNLRKVNLFSVELSEEIIRAGRVQMQWENVALIEHKKSGDDSSLILHSKLKNKMEIPGGLDGFYYVKAFIENHAINAPRSGEKRLVAEGEKIRFFLAMIQHWKKLGYDYSKRFDLLKNAGFGRKMADFYLGFAESNDVDPKETRKIFAQIKGWKNQGVDEPQRIDRLENQGFNHVTAKMLVQEAERN